MGHYDYEKVPVMLACNDDYGNCDGQIRLVDISDALYLEHSGFMQDEGLAFKRVNTEEGYVIEIGGERFHYFSFKPHVGNMCWCLYWMYVKDFRPFLNHLRRTGEFTCTEAESRLYRWWEAGKEFGDTEMRLILKGTQHFRL